jgi:hypothetical protein
LFLLAAYIAIDIQQRMVGKTHNIEPADVSIASWVVPMLIGALVTLVVIGLYVEWLAIVGCAREMRVTVLGVAALAAAGLCLAIGWIDAGFAVLAIGFIAWL